MNEALTAEWWQWALSIPASVHPLRRDPDTGPGEIDPSSDLCMVGQHGQAWFLGGFMAVADIPPAPGATAAAESRPAHVTRTCRVPLGTSILMPVLNAECSTAEEIALGNLDVNAPLPQKLSYLRRCASGIADAIAAATASFGKVGEKPRNLDVKRVATNRAFLVAYPPDNILGLADPRLANLNPNPSLAFADGYWTLFKPAKPGTYRLTTYGAAPDLNFELRIRYILTVVPPRTQ